MSRFLSRYPEGIAGIALLLVRLCCASAAFPALLRLPPAHSLVLTTIASAVLALPMVAGLGTRIVAAMLAALAAAAALTATGDIRLMFAGAVAACTALLLIGPGAYAVDAHLFGRRVIRLAPRYPDRGGRN